MRILMPIYFQLSEKERDNNNNRKNNLVKWFSFPTFGVSPTKFYYVKICVREGKTKIEKRGK